MIAYLKKESSNLTGICVKCFIISILILFGIGSLWMIIATFLFALFALLLEQNSNRRILYIVFLYPFSEIFIIKNGTMSLFTVLYVVHFLLLLFARNNLMKIKILLLMFVIFVIFCALQSGLITGFVMIIGFLYLDFITYDICESRELDLPRNMVLFFIMGMILASIAGMLSEYIPGLSNLLQYKTTKLADTSRITRFSGLGTSPASYSHDIAMGIACLMVLYYNRKLGKLFYPIVAALLAFGLLSASKAFVISGAVLIAGYLALSYQKKFSYGVKITVAIIATAIIVYYSIDSNTREQLILRFATDFESDNYNTLTSGRFTIAIEYLNYIISNIKILLVGDGLAQNLVNGRASHNAYIELVYSFGLVGGMLYIGALFSVLHSPKSPKRRYLISYLPLVHLLVRLVGINFIYRDGVYIHYLLVWSMLNYNRLASLSDAERRSCFYDN